MFWKILYFSVLFVMIRSVDVKVSGGGRACIDLANLQTVPTDIH